MKKSKSYYSLRSYLSYMYQHKGRFTVAIIMFAISNLLIAVIPVFIGELVGSLSAEPVQRSNAIMYTLLLIGCSTGHDLLWRLSEIYYMNKLNPLPYLYEKILFREVITKPYPYFVDKFTGKVASYINTISQELRGLIDNICYNYTGQLVNLIAVTAILTSVNWQTGVIFVFGMISMVFIGRYTIRNSSKYEKLATEVQSTKNAKIIDSIANFVNVKSFRKEAKEIKFIDQEVAATIKAARKSFIWALVFWGSMSTVIRNFLWPITIALNVYLFMQGEISIAQLTTVLSTILMFSSTVWEILWDISQFNLKAARAEEAHTYLFGNQNVVLSHNRHTSAKLAKPSFKKQLELKHLSFSYPDKKKTSVLNDINLTLRYGEKLGIVGRSGSGKTTLTKLLLDYYSIDGESLVVDGQTVHSSQVAELISYVPQDTSLFHRTIAENIAYAADREVSQNEIIEAAKLAHAHEFIEKISDGYNALVGERGVKLSAGQRQRIAIARAFLDDKPILILDEATSALDSESEVLVQKALENLWDRKTVVAIAHRLSTLRNMDRIIVLDGGKIAEEGNHSKLLEKNGTYARLWAHQSGGFLEE